MRGMMPIAAERHIRWGRSYPTLGDCMTCMGMCGSGARIGMVYIPAGLPSTRRGLQREVRQCPRQLAPRARFEAATGVTPTRPAVQRSASPPSRVARTTLWVSGLSWPQVSLERKGGEVDWSRPGGAKDERNLAVEGAMNIYTRRRCYKTKIGINTNKDEGKLHRENYAH